MICVNFDSVLIPHIWCNLSQRLYLCVLRPSCECSVGQKAPLVIELAEMRRRVRHLVALKMLFKRTKSQLTDVS